MRISDWSSDVCSSDLALVELLDPARQVTDLHRAGIGDVDPLDPRGPGLVGQSGAVTLGARGEHDRAFDERADVGDRKSVVEGKSVSVRVDLGGRRNIHKKIINLY